MAQAGTARGTLYNSAAQVFNFLAGYAVYIFIGRALGPDSLGAYGIATAAMAVFAMLNSGLSFELLKNGGRGLSSALKTQALASAALIAAFFLGGRLLEAQFGGAAIVFYLQLLALSIPFQFFFSALTSAMAGLKKFKESALAVFSYGIFRIVFTLGLVAAGFGLFGAFSGYVLSFLLAALVARLLLKPGKPEARVKPSALVAAALPMTIASVAFYLLQSVDLFAVKAFLRDNALAGFYVAASTIARAQFFAFTTLSATLVPVLSGSMKDAGKSSFYARSFLRYCLIGLVPLTLVFAATAEPLVTALYSEEFAFAALPFSILAVAGAFLTLFYLLLFGVVAVYDAAFATKAVLAILALDAILVCALVPAYGLEGAAFASLASFAIGFALAFAKAREKFASLFDTRSLARVSLCSLAVFAAAIWATPFLPGPLWVFAEYAILGAAYLALLILSGEITEDDRKVARKALPFASKLL